MNDDRTTLLIRLGKAQVEAMFKLSEEGPAIDDSEFLPLVEVVLTAFEAIDRAVADELWEHAYAIYDRMCKDVAPTSTTDENRELMQSYLWGDRRRK
jgi:hypothetical protein